MSADERILTDMVEAIVREVDPDKIILFGSYARGNAHPESDIDLLIIRKGSFEHGNSRRQEIHRIRRAISGFRVPKGIILYSSDEVDKWQHSPNHIVARCFKEGKTLYVRS